MAVLALRSIQQTDGVRRYPIDDHGKVRHQYFELAPVVVAGDIGTTIELCRLPPGRTRILPYSCRMLSAGFGAGRTVSIGHRSYSSRDDSTGIVNAEDPIALANAVAMTDGTAVVFNANKIKFDIYSKTEVYLFATIGGGTLPVGAVLSGIISYVYE